MCVCVCITLTNNMYITLFKPFGHLYSLFYFCNTSKTIFSLNIFNMVYIIYLIISIPVMYVALMLHLFCCWFYLCYLVSTCTLWFFGGCIFVFALLEILSLGIFWARDWSVFFERIYVSASGELLGVRPAENHLKSLTLGFYLTLKGSVNSRPSIVWASVSG